MQFSHSRIECFRKCKYQFKLRYIDKLKTLPPTDANNALLLGLALHKGIETDVETAIKEYYNSFPIIDDLVINEALKLENLIPKVKAILPEGYHETKIENPDFVSFLDLITPNPDGSFDLYDFKYSNNVKSYMESGQLHEYKYFYESQTGQTIRKMYFVFVPKLQIRQKKTEDLQQFRTRLMGDLEKAVPQIVEVPFDYTKVIDFYASIKECLETNEFPKNPTRLCDWCDYQKYCESDGKINYNVILPGEHGYAR